MRRWPNSNPLLSSHFKWQFIHSHIADSHWLSAAGCHCGNPQSQLWKWTGALVCRPGTNCGLVPPMPPSPLLLSMTCASYSSYCLELQVSICLYGMSPLQQPATPPLDGFFSLLWLTFTFVSNPVPMLTLSGSSPWLLLWCKCVSFGLICTSAPLHPSLRAVSYSHWGSSCPFLGLQMPEIRDDAPLNFISPVARMVLAIV